MKREGTGPGRQHQRRREYSPGFLLRLRLNFWGLEDGRLKPLLGGVGNRRFPLLRLKPFTNCLGLKKVFFIHSQVGIKENRIYITGEFTRKKQPFCCTVAILQVYFIYLSYYLSDPGTLFLRKSKINVKRKSNYKIGWFLNWLMIISHGL